MYAITIFINQAGVQLLYKKEDLARDAATALTHDPAQAFGPAKWVHVLDDFGHEISVDSKSISAIVFEDMERTKLAHVERALHQQRAQNLAQKTAQSDPALRMSAPNGPGIVTPFPPVPRNN
jgi:hypothetical protein